MRHRLFALLGVSLLLAVTPAVGRSVRDAQQEPARLADKPDEWPQVKAGVWEIAGSWTPRQGKVKTWKENTSQCEDPTALFQGYWGDGIVERAGCRFQSELSLARGMGPRLARTMGPGDGHRGPADQMPQIAGRSEPGGPRQGADVRPAQRRLAGALRRGLAGGFFTGAEGGGPSASMFGLSLAR